MEVRLNTTRLQAERSSSVFTSVCSRSVRRLGKRDKSVANRIFLADQSLAGLTTTKTAAVDPQGSGGNWRNVGGRGRFVFQQRKMRKDESEGLGVEMLTVGTLTGKLEVTLTCRKADLLCDPL